MFGDFGSSCKYLHPMQILQGMMMISCRAFKNLSKLHMRHIVYSPATAVLALIHGSVERKQQTGNHHDRRNFPFHHVSNHADQAIKPFPTISMDTKAAAEATWSTEVHGTACMQITCHERMTNHGMACSMVFQARQTPPQAH